MTAPARFKKRDVKCALAAANESGYPSVRVEIDAAGKIVIIASQSEQAVASNPWDEVLPS